MTSPPPSIVNGKSDAAENCQKLGILKTPRNWGSFNKRGIRASVSGELAGDRLQEADVAKQHVRGWRVSKPMADIAKSTRFAQSGLGGAAYGYATATTVPSSLDGFHQSQSGPPDLAAVRFWMRMLISQCTTDELTKRRGKGFYGMSKKRSEIRRQCVFCGQPATEKNREHILPQWLLELTGDPSRVVTMAINPQSGEQIKFAWSALVMPACQACNEKYGKLEEAVKPIVLSLLDRKPMTSRHAFVLLDWLDKVRICLWLNQTILQGNIEMLARSQLHMSAAVGAVDPPEAVRPRTVRNYAATIVIF